METYKRWVRTNKDYVRSLESLANGLTWFLPERFSDSEIGPEAVTAILGTITAINSHIIDTNPTWIHRGSSESSFPYALSISATKELESLVEVVAQQIYGDDNKWNFIAVTEGIKLLLRLALFHNSGYKMLLHGGEVPNVENRTDTTSPQHMNGHYMSAGEPWRGFQRQKTWSLEGKALSALNKFGENARMASSPGRLQSVQEMFSVMNSPSPGIKRPTLSTVLSERGLYGGLFMLSEVLCITRPLIYVLFIRKYGIQSWVPWFLSLAVDLAGMGILSLLTPSHNTKDQQFILSDSEKDEVKRRKLLWALYLMRDPFYSKHTRKRLESTNKLMEPVPFIGMLTAKIVELLAGAQTRYTYVSGS